MSRLKHLIALAPLLAANSLPAQEAGNASAAAASTPAPYVLKKRSSFSIPAEARAPFWPIGWSKNSGAEAPVPGKVIITEPSATKFLIQPEHFNVTSVLSGNPPLVTINGRAFGEGELLPVVAGNSRLRVVVKTIRDGGVFLQQDNHVIFVPLRRAEVPARAAENPLVAEDFTIKVK